MRTALTVVATLLILLAAAALVAYSGAYNVAADEPHWQFTERIAAAVRARSIARRVRDLRVPNLADEKRIAVGGAQYAEMCESCHFAPGVGDSELRRGLYPKPPELARERMDAGESFWILKHGIKMTAMSAWGPTHDDDTLWSIVAFLQKLPELDAKGYRELVAKAAPQEEKAHGAPAHKHSTH